MGEANEKKFRDEIEEMDSDDSEGSTDDDESVEMGNVTAEEVSQYSNGFTSLSDVENYGECSEVKAEADPLRIEEATAEANVRKQVLSLYHNLIVFVSGTGFSVTFSCSSYYKDVN